MVAPRVVVVVVMLQLALDMIVLQLLQPLPLAAALLLPVRSSTGGWRFRWSPIGKIGLPMKLS
jgi:hypothetical protein